MHTYAPAHTAQPERQKGFPLTGHSEVVPEHTLNSSVLSIINLPWTCITSQGPRETRVLLFSCLSRFWLKIRLLDTWVGFWWLLGVAAVSSQRQDVAQGTWLLLLLSHGASWVQPRGAGVVCLDAHGAPLCPSSALTSLRSRA